MQPREDGSDLNQWPQGRPQFRPAMEGFFDAASGIAARTLSLVLKALERFDEWSCVSGRGSENV